jgi:CheY-like chemotaxis protein
MEQQMDEQHEGGIFAEAETSTLNREQRHAMKNIFSIIIANAEMIGEELAASGQMRRRIERIIEASRRGEQLLTANRTLSRQQGHVEGMPASKTAAGPVPAKAQRQVLVVDDEPDVVEIIRRYLNKEGLQVQGFTDSLLAMEWLRCNPLRCDLVITDLDMPQLSGATLCDQLQTIRPGLPVIMVTGYDRRVSDAQVADFGIRALLPKPIDRHNLLDTVRRLMSA